VLAVAAAAARAAPAVAPAAAQPQQLSSRALPPPEEEKDGWVACWPTQDTSEPRAARALRQRLLGEPVQRAPAMAHWGRGINRKLGVAEYVANFTGEESWRSITGKLGGVSCEQLQSWLQDGVSVGTCNDPAFKTAASCVGTATPTGATYSGLGRVWTSSLPVESSLYKLREAMESSKAACADSKLSAEGCAGLGDFVLNCEQYPEGLALFDRVDTDNCNSFVLVLAANAYNHHFMWIMMVIAMLYTFLGVNIVADVFMSAIEVITAKTKTVKKVKGDGSEVLVKTKVWNPTVANLSLMALGSSAPEIMLAVLDTINTLGEIPGEMGPSTIVGSAAFNLFVISGVVVCALPDGEVKKIEEMEVFAVTATSSILAYVWMVFVLSDENVAMWEALLTFSLFPLLLGAAFAADRKMCCKKQVSVEQEDDTNSRLLEMAFTSVDGGELTANKDEILKLIKERQAKEGKTADEIAKEILASSEQGTKSRNHYRINAMKSLSGQRRALPSSGVEQPGETASEKEAHLLESTVGPASPEQQAALKEGKLAWIYARSTRLAAFENEGNVTLIVERIGSLSQELSVDYTTEDDTATAGEDYEPQEGTLVFAPNVTEQSITVPIIDDVQWEPDETFNINLSNPRLSGSTSPEGGEQPNVSLRAGMEQCVVTIIDDDEPGVLGFFESREYTCTEDNGTVEINVIRKDGADGVVTVDFSTQDGGGENSAKQGIDYIAKEGKLVFAHQELSQTISVEILNTEKHDKTAQFCVVLTNPGGGALVYKKGGGALATVTISADGDLAETVNALTAVMAKRQEAFKISSSSWSEQFVDAFQCEGGIDEDGNDVSPSRTDYFFHFATIGWKVLFAFIPPTDMCGGWATFFVSLMFIGVITALVGAFAEMFGCFVGLEDSITAITFVALGTSLPDTFASQHAAKDDSSADAAIGNVTGSNSVNVFLGLGLPWVIAAVHSLATGNINQATGEVGYYVPKGSGLSFSVAIFCVEAMVCIGALMVRRKTVGGELGGRKSATYVWGAFFVSLWLIYIVLSIMITKGHIESPSWL
jgi:solute carrier family 8 (sodium/calcium exchanger)